MVAERIPVPEIRSDDSLFQPFPWRRGLECGQGLMESIAALGLLEPVVCYLGSDGLHLLHGFRRLDAVRRLGWVEVDGIVLPLEQAERAAELFLLLRAGEAEQSGAARALIYSACSRLGLPSQALFSLFSSILHIELHDTVVEMLLEVAALPGEILSFCHSKSFSLKKCHRLCTYGEELLLAVLEISKRVPMSASLFQESLSCFRALIRREGLQLEAIQNEAMTVLEHGEGSLRKYKEWLRDRANPILTKRRQRLDSLARRLSLPENVEVRWDPSLERHELLFSVSIERVDQMREAARLFGRERMSAVVASMLEQL